MKAIVYGTPRCSWCDKVKHMLEDTKIAVEKLDVTESDNLDNMLEVAGNVKTVPQVVIDGKYIGGYTETERYLKGKGLL